MTKISGEGALLGKLHERKKHNIISDLMLHPPTISGGLLIRVTATEP